MKLLSWNVNGLRAVLQKDFYKFLEEHKPDLLGIQEIKAMPDQVKNFQPGPYSQSWNPAEKKGYSGTMILFSNALEEPVSVSCGIGKKEHDTEGRVITAELKDFFFVTVYTPNSGDKLARLDYRKIWDEEFLKYLKKLEKKKPVVVSGDLNVAHNEIDLKNPSNNHNSAGFTNQERESFSTLLNAGFIDTFRFFYPDAKDRYTWWSYRFQARSRNAGWRIDYFLVSEALKDRLKDALILDQVHGSDHCPVGLILKD